VAAVMMAAPTPSAFQSPGGGNLCHRPPAWCLVYCDGANLNAILKVRPVISVSTSCVNLHEIFGTPTAAAGEADRSGYARLVPFLPGPLVSQRDDGSYYLEEAAEASAG
jgi:glycine dehydrogenase subunit 2